MSNAKRSATSELNHDNWDDDVEPEDAGKFSQADENTLKGRVIKKAKRRGIQTADGTPSVFAGFGGFKAAPTGGNSFDFLTKPSNGTANAGFGTVSSNQSFAFGNTNNSNGSTAVPAPFSFGAKPSTTTNGNETTLDNGSKSTDANAVDSNGGSKTNIFQFGSQKNSSSPSIFGGATNKPFAIKSGPKESVFGASAATEKNDYSVEPSNVKTKTESQIQATNLLPLNQIPAFKPTGGSKWTCSTCMVSNEADKSACVCCEAPKPGGAVKTKWTCETCMVGNDAEKDKCVCCEALKPGVEPKKKEAVTSNALGTIAPGGGFKFGVASSGASSAGGSTVGFQFGTSTSSTIQPQGFKFGNESATNTASSGFSSASTSTRDTTKAATLNDTQSAEIITKSSKENVTPTEDFVSDEEVKQVASNSKEFLAHLGALNKQFFDWIDQHLKKNPYILISPCIRDYKKHLAQLTKEYANKKDTDQESSHDSLKNTDKEDTTTSTAEKPAAVKGLLSGIFGNPASTTKTVTSNFSFGSNSQPFTFGQEKKIDSTEVKQASSGNSASGGFSFGNTGTGVSSGSFSFGSSSGAAPTFGSGSMFGQAAAAAMQAKKEGDNADTEENEEDQPPKVEIKQVVEDDAIHSVRCKLFFMKNKEFTEKGLGMLYLKKVNENEEDGKLKTQLLVRAETNLGNILLNIMLNNQMNLEKRKNCIQFVCIPNPEIPGVTAGSPVTMLVKVKGVDQASILEDEMKKRIALI